MTKQQLDNDMQHFIKQSHMNGIDFKKLDSLTDKEKEVLATILDKNGMPLFLWFVITTAYLGMGIGIGWMIWG